MFHCFNLHAIKLFVVSFIAYVALNVAWYCYIMKDFYRTNLAGIIDMPEMGMDMGMFSHTHLLLYLASAFVVAGVIAFVLPLTKGNLVQALIVGGVYGFIISGAHQVMNYALIANWPAEVVYYSIGWMVVVLAVVSALAVYVADLCGCQHISCGCDLKGKNKCQ